MALAPGTRLGGYEILTLIGVGGMGDVYRAHDLKLKRDVALKVLPDASAQDPDRLARFQREAELLATLNHPNIAAIFSIEDSDHVRFMTMELLDGRTLDRITPEGGVSMALIFDIALALADGLSAAHRKHIIHRDLKPSNVMVTADARVKILDFGLARMVDADGVQSSDAVTRLDLTEAGKMVGTIPYMSPEQIEGRPLDHRTDLFSFGIILYELATGERPFRGDSSAALMSAILRDCPTPIADRRRDIPHDVSRLIGRCLEKQPRNRMQTADEILVELNAQRRAWGSGSAGGHNLPAVDRRPRPAERVPSIAVLAFADMSPAKDQDWFCDGIAEEILNALTPLNGLRVAARTSAFSFKGKSVDLRTIGETLNVTTVLEGSVRRAGDRVRITVQLSDVTVGFQLWSERYDRELEDIFDVQDDIARAITERLRVTLTGGGKDGRLVAQATTNIEAYQLFLKGRTRLSRFGAGIPAALDLFREAVEMDPGYSLAWAAIADAFTGMTITGSVSGSESKPQAIAAATRSIELDPASVAGHTALAIVTLLYENNRAKAKQEFERALQIMPSYAMGRSRYALFCLQWAFGEFERGIAEARRALEADPLSAYVTFLLGLCLCTAGRMDEAIETCRRAVHQDPESFVARWGLGVSLGTAGRFEEAIPTLETGAAMSGRHPRALTSLAVVFGQWGKPLDASALHRELMDGASRAYVPLTYLSLSADASGQHEEAVAFARRAWDEREPTFVLHARHFPEFRPLHTDPRFAAILREMDES